MFSGVAVTTQYRLSCNFIETYVKFNMTAAIYSVDCFRFVGRHLVVNRPDFLQNFNRVFVFPAAILDFRCNMGQ